MNSARLLKIVNLILGILIINQFCSAFLRGVIGRDAFEIFHEKGAILLLIFIVLHIFLNRKWIINSYFKKAK